MAERTVPIWRRLDWRLWRQSYMQTPEAERLAWVQVIPTGDTPPETAAKEGRLLVHVLEISLGGIVLASPQPVKDGKLLRVTVRNSSGSAEPIEVIARVIQCASRSGGKYLLSCCFARELSEEDLQLFGAQRIRPNGGNDIRAWVRFPFDGESIFHSLVTADHEKTRAKVLNISAGGVGLLVARNIEVGTLLNLELSGEGKPKRSFKARVVHVTPKTENQWILGCTFVGELSDEDMLVLL
jgi:hypothetical protein